MVSSMKRRIRAMLMAIGAIAAVSQVNSIAQAQTATETIRLSPRFSPNPVVIRGVGSSSIAVKNVVGRSDSPTGECTGYTGVKPNHILVLSSFFESLSLQVQSAADTALAIQGPGGVWCNDDYDGKNPGIAGQWLPGTYRIWVSTYTKNLTPDYVLRITEQR